jgi:patatin-like phospholipase/acyl hydrolase
MERINVAIVQLSSDSQEIKKVEPQDVFQLVAGTSTGGLITVMLGKLGMTVDECIAQYHQVSKTIFGKKLLMGKWTFGLAKERYSGKLLRQCVSKLVESKKGDKDLPMVCENPQDRIAW